MTGLVLTHGAGGNRDMPLLMAAEKAFSARGVTVERYNLPFRQKRPRGAPHPSGAAADRAGLREAVEAMRQRTGGAAWMGGQSYGGRQSTMLAAEVPSFAEGLLLFSYPLHPPGKPEQLRTAHFPALRTPCVFVHGTKDPFGSIEELQAALKLIPAPVHLIVVEGAGHDLKRGAFDFAPVLAATMNP